MKSDEPISLSRDCDAIMIPSGDKVTLPAGSQVWIRQSLGGSYTVMTDHGYMVRISGEDADTLGMEKSEVPQPLTTEAAREGRDVEKLVWEQLKTCFDPEIPVNIVDLGLVYQCCVIPLGDGKNRAEVKFTLTAPGCGMGAILQEEMRHKILSLPGMEEVKVELVLDPPWDQSMMSEAAKLQLGML